MRKAKEPTFLVSEVEKQFLDLLNEVGTSPVDAVIDLAVAYEGYAAGLPSGCDQRAHLEGLAKQLRRFYSANFDKCPPHYSRSLHHGRS